MDRWIRWASTAVWVVAGVLAGIMIGLTIAPKPVYYAPDTPREESAPEIGAAPAASEPADNAAAPAAAELKPPDSVIRNAIENTIREGVVVRDTTGGSENTGASSGGGATGGGASSGGATGDGGTASGATGGTGTDATDDASTGADNSGDAAGAGDGNDSGGAGRPILGGFGSSSDSDNDNDNDNDEQGNNE
ncbi:MAG: hypothetical protein LBS10_11565 [Gracilibacteraceae bacterium]|jgi:hypothetical protein|nr:hypothetical protein [Gracilibacteraceae bacterium]